MNIRLNPLLGALTIVAAGIMTASSSALAENIHDPHAHHHMMHDMTEHGAMPQTKLSTVDYKLPPVRLVRDDGSSVSFPAELDDGRPVVMNFIYTSCTAICPVTSKTFSQLQGKLGAERDKVHLVSISIDPEQDTPSALRDYARKYGAGAGWQHYTGSAEASIAIQRAFDVFRGDKMNHTPVTLLRAAPGKPWLRVDGFASADELLHDYHELLAAK